MTKIFFIKKKKRKKKEKKKVKVKEKGVGLVMVTVVGAGECMKKHMGRHPCCSKPFNHTL